MPNQEAAPGAVDNLIQSLGAMSEDDLRNLRRAIRQEMEKRGIVPARAAGKGGGGGGRGGGGGGGGGRGKQRAE